MTSNMLRVIDDHGEFAGLGDDDHAQYLKEEASGGVASEVPDHTHADASEAGAIKLDDLVAPDDNTDLNASTSAHGLLLKLNNVVTDFLNGQGAWSVPAGGGGGFYDAYVCVRDKKVQGTQGGTFTQGAWRTRDLNDEHADTAGIAVIGSNQITLAAGTYRTFISSSCFRANNHQLRLYNISDSTVLLLGQSGSTDPAITVNDRTAIQGRFTLVTERVLEVQHQCSTTTADYGFGLRSNFTDEIYTVAEFWREA